MKTLVYPTIKEKNICHETIRESWYDVSENYKDTNL